MAPMKPDQLKRLRVARVPSVGNRVAVALELAEATQMDLARATGLTPQYITDVKTGRFQTITIENGHKFAKFFGCHIEDLFPSRLVAS